MRTFILLFFWIFGRVLPSPTYGSMSPSRFPQPEFDTGYQAKAISQVIWRSEFWAPFDVLVLLAVLTLTTWFLHYRRSRAGITGVSIFSLLYFGFFRLGCVCPIGAIQNVSLGLSDTSFIVPIPVIAFFSLPLLFALFYGRVFCGGACPLGAIQDLVLISPVKIPRFLNAALSPLPWLYLGLAILLAATNTTFIICRFDPFVPIFRLSGPVPMVTLGIGFLILGTVIGRPYCRFLCPYGALLGLFSRTSRRFVSTTPTECISCALCAEACPYGSIDPPAHGHRENRSRAWLMLFTLPIVGCLLGFGVSPTLSLLHDDVYLATRILSDEQDLTDRVRSFETSNQSTEQLALRVRNVQSKFRFGSTILGGFLGMMILTGCLWAMRARRSSRYTVEPASCLSCARCYVSCPIPPVGARSTRSGVSTSGEA